MIESLRYRSRAGIGHFPITHACNPCSNLATLCCDKEQRRLDERAISRAGCPGLPRSFEKASRAYCQKACLFKVKERSRFRFALSVMYGLHMFQLLKHAVRDQPFLRAGALRVGTLVRSMERAEPGIFTLCYHHVTAEAQASFSAQIDFLKRFGTFIDADTALEFVRSGRALRERAFVLSFDDGYADSIEVALPVIMRQRVPAILFLVSA